MQKLDKEAITPTLTVDSVKHLMQAHGKCWAVVLAGTSRDVQYVTWGKEPEDKVNASDLGEEIASWVDQGSCSSLNPATGPATVLESFKLDAARNKAALDRLRDLARQALEDLERFPSLSGFFLRRQAISQLKVDLQGGSTPGGQS